RRLAPGPGEHRSRHCAPAPGADEPPPRRGQAQVPRRLRSRDGRVDRRYPAGAGRRAPARSRRIDPGSDRMTTSTTAAQARALFTELTGHAPTAIWSAPGRVNLIGEHTD